MKCYDELAKFKPIHSTKDEKVVFSSFDLHKLHKA